MQPIPYQSPPVKPGEGMKQQQQFPKYKDEKKAGTPKRLLGDTLAGRFVRSAVQTASSTWKLPECPHGVTVTGLFATLPNGG